MLLKVEAGLSVSSATDLDLAPLECDLADARRHLPAAPEETLIDFAVRQLRSRQGLTNLLAFYRAYPCRLAHLHLLAASAVALGRFCGFSPAYGQMGDELLQVTPDGLPRGAAWRAYAEACSAGRPVEIRDELWLEAHYSDLAAVREAGLEARVYAEAPGRAEPTWRLLAEHMEIALGTRPMVR